MLFRSERDRALGVEDEVVEETERVVDGRVDGFVRAVERTAARLRVLEDIREASSVV